MKGLLIKDFKLLKTQRRFFIIIAAFCILFLAKGQDVAGVFVYASAMLAMVVAVTITYDQLDNGLNFIFTFPVSRKSYVLEKYVFGMLMTVCMMAVLSVCILVMRAAMPVLYNPQEYFSGIFGILMSSVAIMSFMIPIQLKFGAEKSRYATLILVGGVAFAAYAVREAAKAMHIDLETEVRWIVKAELAEVAACLLVLAVVLLGGSYMVSAAVMKKKQF